MQATSAVHIACFKCLLTVRKILQHKSHFYANHWDPSQLTYFKRYFEDYSEISLSKYRFEMCKFTRIPIIGLKVSFMMQNFSQCTHPPSRVVCVVVFEGNFKQNISKTFYFTKGNFKQNKHSSSLATESAWEMQFVSSFCWHKIFAAYVRYYGPS